ncbi:MAG: RsmB/NOP family class I SAM-dependent RNA methyltransferase [Bacteroidetes bacterium]|nr:RsmB/NOP family class I SAM-dependent RNA methyltransferase [Bacteroidota bacterium]
MHDKFPNEFTARVAGQGYIESESLLAALAAESPVSVRINRAKWAGAPAGATPVPWCGSGYWLPARPVFTIDPLFQAGCYYVQEASGMFLEQAVRHTGCDAPGLRILDLCAAPGGKATHLASLAGPGSMVIANEVIRSRASVLAANITRWGTGNTIVTCSDPSAFGKLEGYFDMILADAPCSGEGMFRDEVARREWSTSNCDLCAGRQRRILSSVWPALKRRGVLVYSTCTFNPAENEEVTDWMMKSFYCSADLPPVTGFDGITVVPGGSGTAGYGFYPGKVRGEGLFMSVLRRNDGTAGSPEFSSRDGTVRRLAGNLLAEAARLAGAGAERLVMTSDTSGFLHSSVLYRPEYLFSQWQAAISYPGTR